MPAGTRLRFLQKDDVTVKPGARDVRIARAEAIPRFEWKWMDNPSMDGPTPPDCPPAFAVMRGPLPLVTVMIAGKDRRFIETEIVGAPREAAPFML